MNGCLAVRHVDLTDVIVIFATQSPCSGSQLPGIIPGILGTERLAHQYGFEQPRSLCTALVS